jgi:hypothetical protein
MADRDLRSLERAAAQGDVEAAAKLLLERVRAGDLTEERLQLAAYLGHTAAIRAGGRAGAYRDAASASYRTPGLARQLASHPKPAVHPGNQAGLMPGLARWGDQALLRGATAAARLALPVFEVGTGEPERSAAGEALQRLHAWIAGSEEDAARVVEPLDTIFAVAEEVREDLLGGLGDSVLPHWDLDLPDEVARDIPYALGWSQATEPAFRALEAACEACARAEHRRSLTTEAVWHAALAPAYEAVLACVESELIPWALGHADPVRMRVAKRGEVEVSAEALGET